MSYDCIRIERTRGGFEVHCTDPAVRDANNKRSERKGNADEPTSEWRDPHVEFTFETKAQVLKFIESAMDIALPEDAYTSAFDKLAKEALK